MDPVTVIGVLGSVVSIGDVVGASIKKLIALKSAYRNIPLVTTSLVGQLRIIQIALDQLESICDAQLFQRHPRYHQLAMHIGPALESFHPLMLALQEKLENVVVGKDITTVKHKISFLWNESDVNHCSTLVDRQVNALNLLVQAIQCNTWAEQQQVVDDDENQIVIQLARDCSSSIIGLSHQESAVTETIEDISAKFEFDALILGCKPYLDAHRSHLRQKIRSTHLKTEPDDPQAEDVASMSSSYAEDHLSNELDSSTIQSIGASTIHRIDSQTLETNHRNSNEALLVQSRTDIVKEVLHTLSEITLQAVQPLLPITTDTKPSKAFSNIFRNATKMRHQQSEPVQSATKILLPSLKPSIKTLVLGGPQSGKSTLTKGLTLLVTENLRFDTQFSFRKAVFS